MSKNPKDSRHRRRKGMLEAGVYKCQTNGGALARPLIFSIKAVPQITVFPETVSLISEVEYLACCLNAPHGQSSYGASLPFSIDADFIRRISNSSESLRTYCF
ncbi:MAG: hypothetical protein ACLUN5_02615 [Oscillospiraceae bacterium]